MTPALSVYLAAWLAACALALWLYLRDRGAYVVSRPAYWRFVLAPWKATTFALAATGMVVVAPYTGDPTWDYFDAAFMSIFCYATAPWAVGTVYRLAQRRAHWREIYVMACAWMFTVSWSYDGYMLLKSGYYPATWQSNIALSSILYVSAGLLWSLEHRPGSGVAFGFTRDDWPQPLPGGGGFGRVAWFALPFMALAAALVLAFVVPFVGG